MQTVSISIDTRRRSFSELTDPQQWSRAGVRMIKRGVDLFAAIIGLMLASLMLPFIALAIYIDSPGPIFYKQRRASGVSPRGRRERCRFAQFDMWKLRSMRVDAEAKTGPTLACENDPRITRVGRFLRKSRLDEIPQLWNVLMGDMSLIGPRPERPELFENLALAIPFFEERMRECKPGLTGLAQVSLEYAGNARRGTDIAAVENYLINPFKLSQAEGSEADGMRTKLLFDLAYVASLEHMSSFLMMELSILIKTPWTMIRGLGR